MRIGGKVSVNLLKPIFKYIWSVTDKADQRRIASQTAPDAVSTVCDIPYINDLNKYHLLDIYYPRGNNKILPVIMDIHGGGWWYGTKEINKYYCMALAQKGFVVVNINYRLIDRVLFIEQLRDVFAAVKWVDDNIEKYNGDINNVFITGDSAGGQLCLLTAQFNTSADARKKLFLEDNNIVFKAAAVTSPAADLISPNIKLNSNLTSLLGTTKHKNSPYYYLMDFKNVADRNFPPVYIVTSSGDFLRSQSYRISSILSDLKVEHRLRDFTETYRGKKLGHVFSVIDPFIEPSKKVINELTGFFKSHME